MTGRSTVLLVSGLALLSGCGQRYQPSIRLVSYHQDDKRIATPAPPPQEENDAVCPGTRMHPRISDRAKPGEDPKQVAEARAKLVSRARSKQVDPKALQGGDSLVAGIVDAVRQLPSANSREVRIGGRCLQAPKTWTREQLPIGPVLAAFNLPRAAGDKEETQLTVSMVAQNDPGGIKSLRAQLDEKPEAGSVEHLKIGGHDVILEDISGNSDSGEPIPSPVSEGRYRVLNATVFIGGSAFLINCSGPEKTVGERASEFRGFLQSMKSVD